MHACMHPHTHLISHLDIYINGFESVFDLFFQKFKANYEIFNIACHTFLLFF